ncbi:hypothetical protein [Corynebacterium camporealensis]
MISAKGTQRMKTWQTVAASLFFGVFLYFATLGNLLAALVPLLFLVVLIALSSATFKAANKQDKAPIAMIVMLIVLTVLAYLFPEERGYAASLTIAGVVLVLAFLALRGKSAQTVNQAH